MFLRSFASMLLPKCSGDLKYGPCPPTRDWGSCVSGLVFCVATYAKVPDWSPTSLPQPTCILPRALCIVPCSVLRALLFASYATLHSTLYISLSICRFVGESTFTFCRLKPHCSYPNAGVKSNMAPAPPQVR